MSRSSALRSFIAASGSRRKSSRSSWRVKPCRKRLRRRPRPLRSRSKMYLLKECDRHRGGHRQVVVVMPAAGTVVQGTAHDEPHDDFRPLVAAEAHEVLDAHGGKFLRIAVDQLEELAIPCLVVVARALADHLVRKPAGA